MKSCAVLLLLTGWFASPALAQTRATPSDPVLQRIISVEPDFRDPRTRRLEVLAYVWGNVGLYHPAPSARRMNWDSVLVIAVRDLAAVHTEREFAALLNRDVFAPLNDPLMFATTIADNQVPPDISPQLLTRLLPSGTLYISANNRAYAGPAFSKTLSGIIDSARKTGPVKRLIIDDRSTRPGQYRPGPGGAWLGAWLEKSASRGADISLMRGSSIGDDINSYNFRISPRDSLPALSPRISLPTVFLVNRASYGGNDRSLDAVRNARNDVAVVFEPTGPIPNLGYNSFQQYYPDSILISHSRTGVLAVDGALGNQLDVCVSRVDMQRLDSLADLAFANRAAAAPRIPFVFTDSRIRDDTVSTTPMSREQHLAGLLKMWFWTLRFDAYTDDASQDWRQLVSKWATPIADAPNDTAYYRLLVRIAQSLHDTHVSIRHPAVTSAFQLGDYTIPAAVRYVENRALIVGADSAAAAAGLSAGDEIVRVNGRTFAQLSRENDPYWSSSYADSLPLLREFLFGPQNSPITLTLRTKTGSHDVSLARSSRALAVDALAYADRSAIAVLPGNIGFIDDSRITSAALSDSAFNMLRHTRGLIIDHRSPTARESDLEFFRFLITPAEWMRFVDQVSWQHAGAMPTVGFTTEKIWTVPMTFGKERYTKPIIMMIGRFDISAGESLPQWLKLSKRAVFVGEPTNGTYGSNELISLPGGARYTFTVNRALWPNGGKYHRVGVVPDVIVHPTVNGVRAGRDEVFDAAVTKLRKLIAQ
ncbi:MAG TPA: S41 family peptidase [Gemmatimonadaceae bacterium]|nr:S41 family peptidase [Gemmatimonadaceae bacterium]